MFNFIIYVVLFLGGFWLMGIAHELPEFQALTFVGGILAVCLALGVMVHAPGGATRTKHQ